VLIQILQDTYESEPEDRIQALINRLIQKGLMHRRPESDAVPNDPVSEEEQRRLADLMGSAPGKPLSEIIIDERGER